MPQRAKATATMLGTEVNIYEEKLSYCNNLISSNAQSMYGDCPIQLLGRPLQKCGNIIQATPGKANYSFRKVPETFPGIYSFAATIL
jgi:hypothetical protein